MTWTYSNDPSSSIKDEVRFLVGDTDCKNPLVLDEEIAYVLSKNTDPLRAAAGVARAVAASFASQVNKSVGDLKLQNSDRQKQFYMLAKVLDTRADEESSPNVYAGGISVSDKASRARDDDRVVPDIKTNLHRNPEGLLPGDGHA